MIKSHDDYFSSNLQSIVSDPVPIRGGNIIEHVPDWKQIPASLSVAETSCVAEGSLTSSFQQFLLIGSGKTIIEHAPIRYANKWMLP
jgi:hypothetical protein